MSALGRCLGSLSMMALLVTNSAHAGESCRLSQEELLAVAQKDQRELCPTNDRCSFFVPEQPHQNCMVQVWVKPLMPGNFQTLIITNDRRVLKRLGGA